MEDLEYSGFWWLPSTPENEVPGTLKLSNSGRINLELMGSFQDRTEQNLGFHTHPIVLGVTKGKLITLYECSGIEPGFSIPGFRSQEYRAKTAFIGAHFTEPSEIRFHKASIEYSYLPDWYGVSSPSGDFVVGDNGIINGYQLNYAYPPEIRVTTAQATISIQHTWARRGNPLEQTISHSALMLIETQEELALKEWDSRFIYPIQNFLSLATNQPNSLESIEVFSSYGTRPPLFQSNVQEYPIKVVFQKSYSGSKREKPLFTNDMLFSFQDIDDFGRIIERWLEISNELDSVCNLFFSIRYSPQMYLENQFLNVSQALESYHRRRIGNQELLEEEHTERIESIVSKTPEEHKEWLEQRLKYSNEPSFRKRIKDLINIAGEVILPLIDNKKAFVNKVYETRNYYTHYDLSLKQRATTGKELYWVIQSLSFLIQVCFLRELGFSSEKSTELISRNEQYQYHRNRRIYEI